LTEQLIPANNYTCSTSQKTPNMEIHLKSGVYQVPQPQPQDKQIKPLSGCHTTEVGSKLKQCELLDLMEWVVARDA
jgi:hypothetical protein